MTTPKVAKHILTGALGLVIPALAMAQGPPPPPPPPTAGGGPPCFPPPCIPVDSGWWILAGSAIILFAYQYYWKPRKQKVN